MRDVGQWIPLRPGRWTIVYDRRMGRLGASLVGLIPLTAIVIAVSCRDATQITVDITTDVPCVGLPNDAGATAPAEPGLFSKNGRVALWLTDPTTPQTVARSCTPDGARSRVGTIAIVPSGSSDDRVSVTVAIDSKDPTRSELCNQTAPSPDCIVARRTVGFIPHTPLTLPIHLSLACAGVDCEKGYTCDNGSCVPADVTCQNETCSTDRDAAIDVSLDVTTDPRNDAILGKCDGGTIGNAQNCMQCGFACAGTCQPWGCQLVTTNPLGAVATQGCIAVQSGVVVWSAAKGATGSVFWVPRTGPTWGTVEANVGVGPVASSTGFFSYVARSPAGTGPSYVRDLIAAQPPSVVLNVMKSQPGPNGDHPWVARGSAVRCASTFNGGNVHGIDCELGWFESYPTPFTHLAIGKASYLAINGASLVFGSAGAGISALSPNTTLAKPSSVAAYGSAEDYVVAGVDGSQYGLFKVTVDLNGSKLVVTQKPFYSQPTPITGIHTFGTSVYFADDSKRIAKVDYNGINTQTALVVVPSVPAGFTAMRGQVCLDVDDVAVYYLVDGLPMRAPK